ncbi:type II secretion system protein [Patescibacteria group bacterium]|nr:type II secretion system protein [Patescibacteria group bacterium]
MNKKGFTLIELLVVIAIIGLISTLSIFALNSARSKSRDSRRVSDIKQIQAALELYYNDRYAYPPGTSVDIANKCLDSKELGFNDTCTTGSYVYMTNIPKTPEPNGDIEYTYTNTDETKKRKYQIEYSLEDITGGIPAGPQTASQAGIWGG